jgi:hypothetical protein
MMNPGPDKRERVDVQTGVWIAGKTLKTLIFAHDVGVENGLIVPSNVLAGNADQHAIIVFDWSQAELYDEISVPEPEARAEEAAFAEIMISLLGGEYPDTPFPHDPDIVSHEDHERFVDFYWRWASGQLSGRAAHTELYAIADSVFGPATYHQFKTYPVRES